jgi:hypothetical protein
MASGRNLSFLALVVVSASMGVLATPTAGTFTQKSSFTIPKSPSGMFFDATSDLLYILCGTNTNGDHYIYAYTTSGTQKCLITIPEASSMSRVDGFYIVGSDAYIVDSQGPIYASTKLGGSVYKVAWTNPCSCSSGTCTSTAASWSPTVTKTWTLSATASSINDGGGNDEYFRNSGIAVVGNYLYAVNGVHPNPTLTCCYPKSLLKVTMADSSIAQKWSYDATTLGHVVDMEGITCGADSCANYIYIGDEYNYIYKLNLATSDAAAAVELQWDINSVVGNVPDDKGIESLTYAASTGFFYAGIQETATVHVLELADASGTTTGTTSGTTSTAAATSGTTSSATTSGTTSGTTTGTTSGASAFYGKHVLLAPMIIFLRVML